MIRECNKCECEFIIEFDTDDNTLCKDCDNMPSDYVSHSDSVNSLKELKIQLGLVKKEKPISPFAPFKQMKRQPELFKRGDKCTFNTETMQAYSYGWWRFVERIGNKVVFNRYRYSVTTAKHQWNTEVLLQKLGIKVDYEIEARKGLQDLDTAIQDYEYTIKSLKEAIKKPRTHKAKNLDRLSQIGRIKAKIKLVKSLQTIKNNAKVYV